jgi:hypothetical protein
MVEGGRKGRSRGKDEAWLLWYMGERQAGGVSSFLVEGEWAERNRVA